MEYKSSLKEEIQTYLEFIEITYSKNYYKHFVSLLSNLDAWLFENDVSKNELNEKNITKWIDTVYGSSVTINFKISIIKKFFEYLHSLDISAFIPPKPKNVSEYIPYYFNSDEISFIVEGADNLSEPDKSKNPKYKLIHYEFPMIIRILYGCGARLGETLSLKVEDIDFDNLTIHFIHDTKNKKQRLVPVHKTLMDIIEKYCIAMHIRYSKESLLFPASNIENASLVSQKCVNRIFNEKVISEMRSKKNLGWHERGPCIHSLRHTFAFNSFKRNEETGLDKNNLVPFLSLYLGHSSLDETEKYLKFFSYMYPEANKIFSNYTNDIFPEVDFDE